MKKKIGTVWLGGCSGCHMSLLDIDERILELAKLADIVKCPIVDGKEFPEVDVALVEGAIAHDEHAEEIRHIRQKSKILVAFGDCAVTGNVSVLRNFFPVADVLGRSYTDSDNNINGNLPMDPDLGKLLHQVRPLADIVHVDYFLPGCPPSANLIFYVLMEILHDRTPDLTSSRLKYG